MVGVPRRIALVAAYSEFGIDVNDCTAERLAASRRDIVCERTALVEYALIEPDFRLRAEPEDVVRIVAQLTR